MQETAFRSEIIFVEFYFPYKSIYRQYETLQIVSDKNTASKLERLSSVAQPRKKFSDIMLQTRTIIADIFCFFHTHICNSSIVWYQLNLCDFWCGPMIIIIFLKDFHVVKDFPQHILQTATKIIEKCPKTFSKKYHKQQFIANMAWDWIVLKNSNGVTL